MRLDGLDLNLLVVFDALMRDRSVTAAGQRLNLSQSATSAALGRLRDYFDDPLFVARGRRLAPTSLALALAPEVGDILMRIRANLIARPGFDPATATRAFRLIVSDYAGIVLMTEVIRRAERQAPGVTFELLPFDDRPADPLLRGEVDFLIFPDRFLSDAHPSQPLFADEFCVVAWTGNRRVGKRLTAKQYLDLGHVSARFGPTRRISFEERELARLGHARRIEVVVQNFAMMATMVVGSERIATLHRRLADIFAAQLPLRILPAPIPVIGFRESLQWPAPLDTDPAAMWLRDLIADVAASLDGGTGTAA